MEFTDKSCGPTGHFHLEVFDGDKLIEVTDEPNLVVSSSRLMLASLLGGGSAAVTRFGIGANGSAPELGNTVLTGLFHNSIGAVDYPNPGVVRFAFGLSGPEAIGMSISEFGLLSSSNILFARKVRSAPLVKTNEISFTGYWTITFKA